MRAFFHPPDAGFPESGGCAAAGAAVVARGKGRSSGTSPETGGRMRRRSGEVPEIRRGNVHRSPR